MAGGTWNFDTGNGYIKGMANWSSSSNGIAANSSSVSISVYFKRTNNGSSKGNITTNVTIQGFGQQTEPNLYVTLTDPNKWTLAFAKNWTIPHDSEGRKQIAIQVSGSANFSIGNFNTTKIVNLDTIPHYTSITQWDVAEVGKTYAKINWGTADTIDWLRCYLNDSEQWTDNPGSVDGTSGSFIYTGAASSGASVPTDSTLEPGTTYKLKCWVRRKDSQQAVMSQNLTFTTSPVAKITNLKNGFTLNAGENLTVNFENYNSNKSKLVLFIQKENSSSYENVAETDETIQQESYTWNLSSISSTIYSKLSTRNSANIRIQCVTTISENGRTNKYIANEINGVIKVLDSDPVFSTFTYGDESKTSQDVLNNTSYMPQGYGNMVVRISTANKAVAKNGASIVKYVLTVSGASYMTAERNYQSSSEVVFTLGSFSNVGDYKISIYAIDSRSNLSPTISYTFKVLQYTYPQFTSISFGRLFDYEAETVLDFVGSYSRLMIGNDEKNTGITFKYRYAKSNETYSSYKNINGLSFSDLSNTIKRVTFSQNTEDDTFGVNGKDSEKLILDNNNSYKFEFVLSDKLVSMSTEIYIEKGVPIMFTGENGQVSIGMIPDITRDEKLQVDGDIMATDSNGNKTGILERMDKLIVVDENEQEQPIGGIWFRIVN